MATLQELINAFYTRFRETSSNTTFSQDKVIDWLNEGYMEILMKTNPKNIDTFEDCSVLRTTVSSQSTGTELFTSSTNYMFPGQILWVGNNRLYEQVVIRSIDWGNNRVVLQPPGLYNVFNTGNNIISAHIKLPNKSQCLKKVTYYKVSQGGVEAGNLVYVNTQDYILDIPYPNVEGVPKNYYIIGARPDIGRHISGLIPYYGNYSTTELTALVLGNQGYEDYYKGFTFVNRSLNKYAYVTLSRNVGSYTYLELSNIITGQSHGHTAEIIDERESMIIHPIPDDSYRIRLLFSQTPPRLIHMYDIPAIPEMYHHLLVYYALKIASRADGDEELARTYYAEFKDKLITMLDNLNFGDLGQLPEFKDGSTFTMPDVRW